VEHDAGSDLPLSTTAEQVTRSVSRVVVSRRGITVDGDDAVLVPLPVPEQWMGGIDEAYKQKGNDLVLVPLVTALAHYKPPSPGPLRLRVDGAVPYRILLEVLASAAQAGYGEQRIVVRTGAGLGEIAVQPPRAGAQVPLGVFISGSGIAIRTPTIRDNIATGCGGAGPGIAVPSAPDGYDFRALRACVATLRDRVPELSGRRDAFVIANPGTPLASIVGVLDALRADDAGRPMFPEIHFGVVQVSPPIPDTASVVNDASITLRDAGPVHGGRERLAVGGAVAAGAVPDFEAVARKMDGRFRTCIDNDLAADPTRIKPGAHIRMSALIRENGEVASLAPSASGLPPQVVACIAATVAGARFQPLAGGRATIVIRAEVRAP
jgi:hypothetical protein